MSGASLLLLAGCASSPTSTVEPPARITDAPPLAEVVRTPDGPAPSPRLSPGASPKTAPRGDMPVQTVHASKTPRLLDLTVSPNDLWQRIRNGFGMSDLHDPLVVDRQSWYLNRPEMLQRIFARGQRYLYHIVGELEKRGMPTELALLPMVESAYNPQAVSSAKAMGIWQFIPSTGKNYDLDQNWWVDERRDIVASTDAALRYLQNVYDMHGDWHLALASYNWGEHAVARAIAKNQAKNLPTDYASLTMPAETRYYVPKLQALKNIIAQPEVFGFHLAPIPNQPYFESVVKPERIDIAVAARLAEMSVEEFVSLNPAYHRLVINGDQAGPLLLPTNKVDTFLANLARHAAEDKPLSNWQTHILAKGETLAKVAARHKLSEGRLRQINGIMGKTKVGPGFSLLVPRPGTLASAEAIAKLMPALTPPTTKAASVTLKSRGRNPARTTPPAGKKPQKKKTDKKIVRSKK